MSRQKKERKKKSHYMKRNSTIPEKTFDERIEEHTKNIEEELYGLHSKERIKK